MESERWLRKWPANRDGGWHSKGRKRSWPALGIEWARATFLQARQRSSGPVHGGYVSQRRSAEKDTVDGGVAAELAVVCAAL